LFPILVHELIKGFFDVLGTQGLPDDPKSQQMIMESTDSLYNEMWDLRLGGFFSERLLNMFPMSVFQDGKKHIQHYLFARLVALDTEEFFEVFQDIMMNNSEGKKFVQDMVYDIEKDMNERALNESLGQYEFGMDEDDEEEGFGLFERGDEVAWNENALEELNEFEGNDDLEITSNVGNLFYASNGNAEYIVFKSYDDAHAFAYVMVNQDLVDNPEYFNQNWLSNFVDIDGAKSYLSEVYDEWNYSYANDIKMESDSKYSNRLISEMVDAGLMDDEDAESEDAESTAISLMDDFVEYMTNSQIDEGGGGLDYYENNFGKEQTMKMIKENNLIDIDEATEGAISEDGVAHFISSYDGNEIELPSGYYAYRTN
jgi:polyhydroxyalkanoate synthesis regulator phasin